LDRFDVRAAGFVGPFGSEHEGVFIGANKQSLHALSRQGMFYWRQ